EALPAPLQQEVARALRARQLPASPAVARIAGGASSFLGSSGPRVPFALIAPVGTAVRSDRPTFRWQLMKGATGYRVTVVDATSLTDAAASEMLPSPGGAPEMAWSPKSPLRPGGIYQWYVVATLADGKEVQSPQSPVVAKFQILGSKDAGALEQALRTAA